MTVGEGHSSPLLAEGKIFVFSREGKQEVVRALDPASGKELWKQSYDAPFKISSAADSHPADLPTHRQWFGHVDLDE